MLSVLRQTLRGYRTSIAMVGLGLLAVSLLIVYSFDAFGVSAPRPNSKNSSPRASVRS